MILLNNILQDRNLSIEDLRSLLEEKGTTLSRITLSKIRDNKSSPKVSTLQNIADALDLNVCDLIEGARANDKEKKPDHLLDEIINKAKELKDIL